MGRSVSYATGATAVAYRILDIEDPEDQSDEFNDLVDWIRERAKELWPSFSDCDEWLGREDHAICENAHAYIGVSEYCGLVSVWLVDREDRYSGYSDFHGTLCKAWCTQIAPKFLREFSELRRLGTFSNGEGVFKRLEAL